MTELPITGGCNCGAVRYEVTEPLTGAAYCHCTRCHRRSGAASGPQARPAPGSFHIVKGEDRLKYWQPEASWRRSFCGDCGSPIASRDPDNDDEMVISMGTLDGHPGIQPSFRVFVNYAAAWEDIPDDGLPRHPENHPGA